MPNPKATVLINESARLDAALGRMLLSPSCDTTNNSRWNTFVPPSEIYVHRVASRLLDAHKLDNGARESPPPIALPASVNFVGPLARHQRAR